MSAVPILKRILAYGGILAIAIAVVGSVIGLIVAGGVGLVSALIGTVMAVVFLGITAASMFYLGSTELGLAQQQPAKPAPADIQQHKTTPGGQYQPSLDTLGGKAFL